MCLFHPPISFHSNVLENRLDHIVQKPDQTDRASYCAAHLVFVAYMNAHPASKIMSLTIWYPGTDLNLIDARTPGHDNLVFPDDIQIGIIDWVNTKRLVANVYRCLPYGKVQTIER